MKLDLGGRESSGAGASGEGRGGGWWPREGEVLVGGAYLMVKEDLVEVGSWKFRDANDGVRAPCPFLDRVLPLFSPGSLLSLSLSIFHSNLASLPDQKKAAVMSHPTGVLLLPPPFPFFSPPPSSLIETDPYKGFGDVRFCFLLARLSSFPLSFPFSPLSSTPRVPRTPQQGSSAKSEH
jgi:hypothetical protein